MRRAMGVAAAVLAAAAGAASVTRAQQPPAWRFHYPEPRADAVRIARDVEYGAADGTRLLMDVYRPARAAAPAPALIFYAPMRTPAGATARVVSEHLRGWARIAAGNGLVAVVPDLRPDAHAADFGRLLAHLASHAGALGVDRERLAVFAASAAVPAALPVVEDPARTEIRAAVVYYGAAELPTFRVDLPLLYVRAGLDGTELNADIVRLAARAAAQNAPLTLLNHHAGHHQFELFDDDVATPRLIDETIAFVRRATEPAYQALLRERRLDAVAAAQLSAGNHGEAARTLAELVRRRPTDGRLSLGYASALLGDRQFGAACAEFRRLAPPSFMAIEPGARACVLAGAVDTAAAWLATVRRDWLLSGGLRALQSDSVFAPLWSRADFRALFRP